MNLSVAIGMDQHAVFSPVCPTQRFIHDVVVVPTCHFRDRLGTDWADAALLFPEVDQGALSSQGLVHLHAKAFLNLSPFGRTLTLSPHRSWYPHHLQDIPLWA